jgi:L-amino acid N-acyltransferase YncA
MSARVTGQSSEQAGVLGGLLVEGQHYDGGRLWQQVQPRPCVRQRGVGQALLEALIASTEAADVWTIQSGVSPENMASLALHERVGFRVVDTRERLERHAARGDRWRDVVLLERRSPRVA